ncbi:MAG: hypothetical protein ABEK04_03380 [Candidatus Nanohalobium sp.]
MVDAGKVLTGAGIIAAGLATPIPIIDEAIGVMIGGPMILAGLGQDQAANELKEKTG